MYIVDQGITIYKLIKSKKDVHLFKELERYTGKFISYKVVIGESKHHKFETWPYLDKQKALVRFNELHTRHNTNFIKRILTKFEYFLLNRILIVIIIFFVYTKSYSQSKERINYEPSISSAYGISLKDWRMGVLYLDDNTKLFGNINYNNYFEIVRIKINDKVLSYGISSILHFRQVSQDGSYKIFIPIYEFNLDSNKEVKKKDKFYEVIYIGSIFLLRKSYVIDLMSNSFIYKDIYYLWKPEHGLVKLPVIKYKHLRELFNKKYHRDLREKFGRLWIRKINYKPRILAKLIVYYNNLIDPDVTDKNIKFLYEEI